LIKDFLNHNLEQAAIFGRARIEKSRLEQIAKIETNRKRALASLKIDYTTADKVRTSFGYIGITFLSVLWGYIILNDLAKLLIECIEETNDLIREKRNKRVNIEKENEIKQVKLDLEQEEEKLAQDLDEKLEKIHLQLLKACSVGRASCLKHVQ
jgi:hypothetical protein